MKDRLCHGSVGHVMIEVVKGLSICECTTYGTLAYLKGAAEEARRLIELEGGYDVVRARVKREAVEKLAAKKKERKELEEHWLSAGKARWVA